MPDLPIIELSIVSPEPLAVCHYVIQLEIRSKQPPSGTSNKTK